MLRHSMLSLALGATLLMGACGSDDADDATTSAPDANSSDTPAAAGVTIDGAWARTSPMMAMAGAAYMTLTSRVDDRLTGVAVDASIAATAELHETVMAGETGGSMPGSTMAGSTMAGSMPPGTEPTMMMQPVDGVDLPAGTTVELKPGGYHIMLLDLAAPLEMGQTFTITLMFELAGPVDVSVTVGDAAP